MVVLPIDNLVRCVHIIFLEPLRPTKKVKQFHIVVEVCQLLVNNFTVLMPINPERINLSCCVGIVCSRISHCSQSS